MSFNVKSKTMPKPFLKWAGGKSQIINELEASLPPKIRKNKEIDNYIEPFIGGGAFFFYLQSSYYIRNSTIIDVNPEIITAYTIIKTKPALLVEKLAFLQNEYLAQDDKLRSAYYYRIRDDFNSFIKNYDYSLDNPQIVERIAQLIFLNKTCFNGLFRQNSKGEFNVPFGRYKNPNIFSPENIFACSDALQHTDIRCGDFSMSEDFINKETVVYFDPPYRPISKTSHFTRYSKLGFTEADQTRLASFYKDMSDKGAFLILSNSDPQHKNPQDKYFEKLYSNFKIKKVTALRTINCNATKRGPLTELIITNCMEE